MGSLKIWYKDSRIVTVSK